MNILKRTIGILLTLFIAASVIAVPTAVSAKSKPNFKFNKKQITVAAGSYKSFYIISKNDQYRINTNVKFKSSNKKVAQFKNEGVPYSAGWNYSTTDEKEPAIIRGYKPGKAVITAYEKGTNRKLGKIKVTVKKIKTSIKKKYKTVKLKYNPVSSSYVYTSLLVNNPKKGATYSAKIKNKKAAKINKGHKSVVNSVLSVKETIEPKKAGKTKVTIYEKFKGKKKTKVGTFTLKASYTTFAKVFKFANSMDGNPMYWDQFQKVGYKFNIKKDFEEHYNLKKYKKYGYKITLENINESVLKLDSDGTVTALKIPGDNEKYGIKITVKFSDKSKVTQTHSGPSIKDDSWFV